VDLYRFRQGSQPLLVSMPHCGTNIPDAMAAQMTAVARRVPDTDWHMPELYDFLAALDVSVISATHSRYVIDLNRAPDSRALYPGASNTELCPLQTFDMEEIYLDGQRPDDAEVAERLETYWRPYHQRIDEELAAIKAHHGLALLWDAHSIRSVLPRFFEGRLTDLNLGTGDGTAAAASLLDILGAVARDAAHLGYTHAVNGRFKGGYITRSHGDPANGIHAVQLELTQSTYMNETPPFGFREDLAEQVRPVLSGLIHAMLAWAELEGQAAGTPSR
jgi:N-formylglutamate deformylase